MSSSESDNEVLMLLNSSDDSSDDTRSNRVYKTRINYYSELDNQEFQLRFRLDKQSVQLLLGEIYPFLKESWNISLTLQFISFFWYFGAVRPTSGVSFVSSWRFVHFTVKTNCNCF
ncbi:uncharacterized protein LOC114245939 isoform X2 [Bombyx mandarina]|uniref:Uncharacterized protein LOC114245939 isoform X2 n=1 Tax=Bombyx mandarina TaxID=7092 RepID=A0A6J2K161_BOMMA|nr:uncharacterized protein LOC114245939 isoform X2 [Bombyx mandarina]